MLAKWGEISMITGQFRLSAGDARTEIRGGMAHEHYHVGTLKPCPAHAGRIGSCLHVGGLSAVHRWKPWTATDGRQMECHRPDRMEFHLACHDHHLHSDGHHDSGHG
ncbi:MAG: hypothetical protein WAU02_01350 [Candidatus Saccharimonadales bacterium]